MFNSFSKLFRVRPIERAPVFIRWEIVTIINWINTKREYLRGISNMSVDVANIIAALHLFDRITAKVCFTVTLSLLLA